MNLKNLMDDNYLTFYMLSDKYIDDQYTTINIPVHVLKKIFRYIKKILFHFYVSFRHYSSIKDQKNKIIFYAITKNNFDSLYPVYMETKKNSVMISSDYRLAKNAVLLPQIFPLIFSIFLIPRFIKNIIDSVPNVRKRIILYLDDTLLSMGFKIFVKIYLKILKPKAIVFANYHSFPARSLIKSAECMNIPCFYIQHSAMTEIFPPIISSYALLEGKDSLKKCYPDGYSKNKVFLIGSPKFDEHKENINTNHRVKKIGICSTPSMNKDQVLKLIEKQKEVFSNDSIIFRPHPSDHINNKYKNQSIIDSINYSDPLKEETFQFLRNVDAIISGNSSVLLDAAIMNVFPILWRDSHTINKYNEKEDQNDKYGFVKNGLAIGCNSIDQINECLIVIIDEKPNVRLKAKYYVENINTKWDGRSAHYAATIIKKNI